MARDFSGLTDIDLDEVPPSKPQTPAGKYVFQTYGTLDKRLVPTEYVKVKVPMWVINLIEKHSEQHTNRTLIYARMLEIAANHYRKCLLEGDVEIKY